MTNTETAKSAHEYIVYACPVGELAAQLERYFAQSLAECGPNTAHQYMPHCTLTGFFHDEPESVPGYLETLEQVLERARHSQPAEIVTILRMELGTEFHGLLLESPWLRALTADFAGQAVSATRRDAIRVKDWLHLSLAYGFAPEQRAALAGLARELVDPQAAAEWELRFYERHADQSWSCHAQWRL